MINNKFSIYDGNKYVGSNGFDSSYNISGSTSSRPTLTSSDLGFQYYDTSLKKYICWNGTAWTNLDGTQLI